MSIDVSPNVWVRVSRKGLRQNVTALRALVAPSVQIIAVVKANAYGHGAAQAACAMQEDGLDFFAITTAEEALELRDAGIQGRILQFLPPLTDQLEALLSQEIILTCCDEIGLREIERVASTLKKTASVHLKIDTGMGRLGVLPGDALALAKLIAASPSVSLEGVYTHFAKALDPDAAPTQRQFDAFLSVLTDLEKAGIKSGLRHCANSAAILRDPKFWLDAVRPGTLLYGQYPAGWLPKKLDLADTWRLEARIVSVRTVPSQTAIGYGGEFVTSRSSKIAVLPIGFADGFTVAPASVTSGWRGVKTLVRDLIRRGPSVTVKVRGISVPVVGRVAMQTCMIDVTDIPDVTVGDIVTVPARRIMTSPRLPRLYED